MAGWRTHKQAALAAIHRTFQHPAVYLTHAAGIPVPVLVRHHAKHVAPKQQIGDWAAAASTYDMATRIVFDLAELPAVLPRAFVIFSPTEAYMTGPTKPERAGYVFCEVTDVTQADLTALLANPLVDTDAPEWDAVLRVET